MTGSLAKRDLPPSPPPFAEVVAEAEKIEGVRFAALFERLPHTAPDGDAALAVVWQLVAEEKSRGGAETQRREEVLASVPPEIREAIERVDNEALAGVLGKLPPEQREAIVQQLRDTGVIGGRTGPDMSQVLQKFEPLLKEIAAAATDESIRPKIEQVLTKLEDNGWQLSDAAHRIWSGARDPDALTADIDPNSAQLVRRVPEFLEE